MPVAIVTGSDSGIGRAAAVALARAGHDIGITWHEDEDGARKTAREVEASGRRAEIRRLDLAQLPGAVDVIDELAGALGGMDVLVNNSGTSRSGPFLELSFDDWTNTLDVDLNGAFLCAQRAARRMVDQGRGGRIVNVTSVHEHVPLGESVAYVTSRAEPRLTREELEQIACDGSSASAFRPNDQSPRRAPGARPPAWGLDGIRKARDPAV